MVIQKHKKYIVLLVIMLLVFTVKYASFTYDMAKVKKKYEGDLNHYVVLSKSMMGMNATEMWRQYQYPPLFAIIIIPALYMDFHAYILLLNITLGALTIIPLWLISKRYVNEYVAMMIAGGVVAVNLIYSVVSFGFPIILSTLLFTCFAYYFIDIHKDKRSYYGSAVFYALLIATKYVFIYMLPFIITWMLLRKHTRLKTKIKTITLWGLPALAVFLGWSIRNMFLYGFNSQGMLGGYSALFRTNLGLRPDLIPSKLASIPHTLMPNTLMTYYLVFSIVVIMIWTYTRKKPEFINKYYSHNDRLFHYLLLFNFAVFFCLPAMTYNKWYLNWRYISYFSSLTLTLVLVLVSIIITETLRQRKQQ